MPDPRLSVVVDVVEVVDVATSVAPIMEDSDAAEVSVVRKELKEKKSMRQKKEIKVRLAVGEDSAELFAVVDPVVEVDSVVISVPADVVDAALDVKVKKANTMNRNNNKKSINITKVVKKTVLVVVDAEDVGVVDAALDEELVAVEAWRVRRNIPLEKARRRPTPKPRVQAVALTARATPLTR